MSNNDFTPQQALELLMRKLAERDGQLVAQVQASVDMGKDVLETEPRTDRRKKQRAYRRTVPYSYDEAFRVAVDALAAYFIEQPLFIKSCLDNMSQSVLGAPPVRSRSSTGETANFTEIPESMNTEKEVEIELRTETQLSERPQETFPLKRLSPEQWHTQQANMRQLLAIADFGEK